MDKDEGTMTDDYIGKFETTVSAGAKEAEIQGPMLRRDRGNFWLKVRVFITNVFTFSFLHSDRVYAFVRPRPSTNIPLLIQWSNSLFPSLLSYRGSPHESG